MPRLCQSQVVGQVRQRRKAPQLLAGLAALSSPRREAQQHALRRAPDGAHGGRDVAGRRGRILRPLAARGRNLCRRRAALQVQREADALALLVHALDPALHRHAEGGGQLLAHLLRGDEAVDVSEEGHDGPVVLHLAHVARDQHVALGLRELRELEVALHQRLLAGEADLSLPGVDAQHPALQPPALLELLRHGCERHVGEVPEVHEAGDVLAELDEDAVLRDAGDVTSHDLPRRELRDGDQAVLLEVVRAARHDETEVQEVVGEDAARELGALVRAVAGLLVRQLAAGAEAGEGGRALLGGRGLCLLWRAAHAEAVLLQRVDRLALQPVADLHRGERLRLVRPVQQVREQSQVNHRLLPRHHGQDAGGDPLLHLELRHLALVVHVDHARERPAEGHDEAAVCGPVVPLGRRRQDLVDPRVHQEAGLQQVHGQGRVPHGLGGLHRDLHGALGAHGLDGDLDDHAQTRLAVHARDLAPLQDALNALQPEAEPENVLLLTFHHCGQPHGLRDALSVEPGVGQCWP
mmetsp:Transcript_8857/g.26186  ORF Transcript_8857/g.26186 Transcript_8857/m.26186 type:complete len:523 (-) Transcript_8857:535-2103(-)